MSLRPFRNTHLDVYRITIDVDVSGLDVGEHITVVVIPVSYSVLVVVETFPHLLLVIHVTAPHAQHLVQILSRYDRVAHPGDVTDVVFLAFIDFDIDVDMLVVHRPHGVLQNLHVTISQLVVFLYELFLGFLVSLISELLRLQERGQFARLMNLSKGTLGEQSALDLAVGEVVVAINDDASYLHLFLLVNHDIQHHLVLARDIVVLTNVHLSVFVALTVKVVNRYVLGAVQHVRSNLAAGHDAQFGLQVLTLRFLYPVIIDSADARTQGEVDAKINLRTDNRVCRNGHLREKTMFPIALNSFGNLAAWHFYTLSHRKTGETCQDIVLITLDAFNGQSANLTLPRCSGIADVRIDNNVLRSYAAK